MVAIELILAALGLVGALLKNKFLLILAVIAFLFVTGMVTNLPSYLWIIIIIVMALWIFTSSGSKR